MPDSFPVCPTLPVQSSSCASKHSEAPAHSQPLEETSWKDTQRYCGAHGPQKGHKVPKESMLNHTDKQDQSSDKGNRLLSIFAPYLQCQSPLQIRIVYVEDMPNIAAARPCGQV